MTRTRTDFDGVVCFGGEDWWYHNRGHFDMQVMRCLADSVPVLYVNSIGMRAPSPREGRMFLRRIGRKLASMRRGLVRVDERFAVLSPVTPPGPAWSGPGRSLLVGGRAREAARDGGRTVRWFDVRRHARQDCVLGRSH